MNNNASETARLKLLLDTPIENLEKTRRNVVHNKITSEIKYMIETVSQSGLHQYFDIPEGKPIDHAIVISLYGSWGSGKTSIIKTLEAKFSESKASDNTNSVPDIFTFSVWDHSGGDIRKSFIRWLSAEIEKKFLQRQGNISPDKVEEEIESKSPKEWEDIYKEALKSEEKKLPRTAKNESPSKEQLAALYKLKTIVGTVLGTRKKVKAKPYRQSPTLIIALIVFALFIINAFASTLFGGITQIDILDYGIAIINGIILGMVSSILYIVSIILFLIPWTKRRVSPKFINLWQWICHTFAITSLIAFPIVSYFYHDLLPNNIIHYSPQNSISMLIYISSAIATASFFFVLFHLVAPTGINPLDFVTGSSEKEEIEDQSTISDVAIDFRNTFIEILFAIRPLLLEGNAKIIKPVIIVIDDLDRLPIEQAHDMLNELRVFTSFSGVVYPPNVDNSTVARNLFFIIPVSTKSLVEDSFNDKFFNKLFFLSYTVPTPTVGEKFEVTKDLIKPLHDVLFQYKSTDKHDFLASVILSSAKLVYTYVNTEEPKENMAADNNHADNSDNMGNTNQGSDNTEETEFYDEITIRDIKKIINHIIFIINQIASENGKTQDISFENFMAITLFSCLEVLGKIETPLDIVAFSKYLRQKAKANQLEWISARMAEDLHFRLIGIYYILKPHAEEEDIDSHPLVRELELILKTPPPALKGADRAIDKIRQHINELFGEVVLPTATDIRHVIERAISNTIAYWKDKERMEGSPTFLHFLYLIYELKKGNKQDIETRENMGTPTTTYTAEETLKRLHTLSTDDIRDLLQKAFREINMRNRILEIENLRNALMEWINGEQVVDLLKVYQWATETVTDILNKHIKDIEDITYATNPKSIELFPVILTVADEKNSFSNYPLSNIAYRSDTEFILSIYSNLSLSQNAEIPADIIEISKDSKPQIESDIAFVSSFSGQRISDYLSSANLHFSAHPLETLETSSSNVALTSTTYSLVVNAPYISHTLLAFNEISSSPS